MKKKLFLISFGFTLSFLILEIGLRTTGYLMTSSREVPLGEAGDRENFRFVKSESKKIKIMALGDSTTNGGTLSLKETYPFMLYNLIEASPLKGKVTVANHGRCEYNSTMTLRQIREELDDYSPDIVLLLSGEADRFNPIGLAENIKDDEARFYKKVESFFLNFRVYKLVRGLVLNLKYKAITENSSYNANEDLAQNNKNIELMLGAADAVERKDEVSAEKLLNQVKPQIPKNLYPSLKDDPNREFGAILEYPQVYQLSSMIGRQQYSEVVKRALEFIGRRPYMLLDEERNAVIYNMFWALDFQSEVLAAEIIDSLKLTARKFKNLSDEKVYQDLIEKLTNYEEIMKTIDRKRVRNLEEMIKLFKERNIEVIVLNYPAEFTVANLALQSLAEKNGFAFVDNYSHFQSLIERDGRKAWLLDDEHPTVNGNKELAQKTFEVLLPKIKKMTNK